MIKDGKILLLQNVSIDNNLPKFKIELDPFGSSNVNFGIVGGNISNNWIGSNDGQQARIKALQSLQSLYSNKPTFKLKCQIWAYKKIFKKYLTSEILKKEISQEDLKLFFDTIKNNVNILDKDSINEVLDKYQLTVLNAQDNNQTALVERILEYAEILKSELILCQSKFNKYLTEDEVVKFYNVASVHEKLKTKLCLTYIKNFVKVIPDDITKLKKEADELKIFDNYVIMHYDYNNDSVSETNEEKEKRKDPILFGVIVGSKNLYYIGDWVDEYCNLTLDAIIKKIGKKANHTLDNKSIKENIDKI
jgi:hypothetical protein